MYAHEVHAHEVHVHEMHAYEMHAFEMHARNAFGGNLQISHLTNAGAVVDLSRPELQNTGFCAKSVTVAHRRYLSYRPPQPTSSALFSYSSPQLAVRQRQ